MTGIQPCLTAFALTLALAGTASPGAAQTPTQPAAPARTLQAPVRSQPPVRIVTETQHASETRDQLMRILERYGRSVGGVLKLDPGLLDNQDYLSPYPELADFLGRHPEVARDPEYFLENVSVAWAVSGHETAWARRDPVVDMWRNALEGLTIFLVFSVVLSALIWLIKTLIDYRRWSRLSKVQTDVHNKLFDRFTNNEELLAYVQTPAGRRFLESAPITLDAASQAVAAPVRRILWAVEAGCVLMAGGIGLQFVSGRSPAEVSPVLYAIGVLGLALGIGFVIAAVVSFLISRRLGLLQQPGPAAPADRVELPR